MTGGSTEDFNRKCYKIFREAGKNAYTVKEMKPMAKKRVFHSMCYLNENEVIVTGSRVSEDGADISVEKLNI